MSPEDIKRYAKIAAAVAAGILLLWALWFLLPIFRFKMLEPPQQVVQASHGKLPISLETLPSRENRSVVYATLHTVDLGDINFVVNVPNPIPLEKSKMPVVFVMGGFATGAKVIGSLSDAGANAVVALDWSVPAMQNVRSAHALVANMPDIVKQFSAIPAQAVTALNWVRQQAWADPDHITLIGFSFGALMLPAVQDAAQADNIPIGWSVVGYGGAPLSAVFAATDDIQPDSMRAMIAARVDDLFATLEPTRHLPNLKGRFLVLEGEDDQSIPLEARVLFRDAVPEPKTVRILSGGHIGGGVGGLAATGAAVSVARQWLLATGAINP